MLMFMLCIVPHQGIMNCKVVAFITKKKKKNMQNAYFPSYSRHSSPILLFCGNISQIPHQTGLSVNVSPSLSTHTILKS